MSKTQSAFADITNFSTESATEDVDLSTGDVFFVIPSK